MFPGSHASSSSMKLTYGVVQAAKPAFRVGAGSPYWTERYVVPYSSTTSLVRSEQLSPTTMIWRGEEISGERSTLVMATESSSARLCVGMTTLTISLSRDKVFTKVYPQTNVLAAYGAWPWHPRQSERDRTLVDTAPLGRQSPSDRHPPRHKQGETAVQLSP